MKKALFELFENSYEMPLEIIEKFKKIVDDQPDDYFGKKSKIAHITGSMITIDETGEYTLLTQHKKLKKWLQLGGHWCDYDASPTETLLESAIRELKEEGYNNADISYKILNNNQIVDLDIHNVGDHFHYDVCFLAEVSRSIAVVVSDESESVEWKNMGEIFADKQSYDSRLIRMLEKAQQIHKKQKKL